MLSLIRDPRCFLLLALLVGSACTPTPGPPPTLQVYFLNVGQGDAVLLRTPDGISVLVDGGDTGRGPGLVMWLRANGVKRVDWVMPSHPHADHIGGLNAVLQQMPVGGALMSAQETGSATYRRQKALLNEKRVPVTLAQEGVVLQLGALVTATILNPPPGLLASNEPEEDNSVVLRVCFQLTCVLFTGDIGDQGERALQARYQDKPDQLRSHVLKVSHHGSAEPNHPALLQLIRPEVALIGVGAGNRFGHPTQQALDRLKTTGAAIFCTHTDGTVLVEITETGYTVTRLPEVVILEASEPTAPPEPALAGRCAG